MKKKIRSLLCVFLILALLCPYFCFAEEEKEEPQTQTVSPSQTATPEQIGNIVDGLVRTALENPSRDYYLAVDHLDRKTVLALLRSGRAGLENGLISACHDSVLSLMHSGTGHSSADTQASVLLRAMGESPEYITYLSELWGVTIRPEISESSSLTDTVIYLENVNAGIFTLTKEEQNTFFPILKKRIFKELDDSFVDYELLHRAARGLYRFVGKGNEDADSAWKAALKGVIDAELQRQGAYWQGNLVQTLSICRISPDSALWTPPGETEPISLLVDGKTLIARLLESLCDENGKFVPLSEVNGETAYTFLEYNSYYQKPAEGEVERTVATSHFCFPALVAYDRFLNGKTAYNDFSDLDAPRPMPQNEPPLFTSDIRAANPQLQQVYSYGRSYSFDFSTCFFDPEGEELTFYVSVNGEEAQAVPADYSFSYGEDGEDGADGEKQTFVLCFYAEDPEGERSPDYTATLDFYPDASLWQLDYIVGESGVTITSSERDADFINVPEEIEGKPVTNLSRRSLASRNLRSVTLPDTILTINAETFEDAGSLESVILPSHLQGIGSKAFSQCVSLKEITIPATVTEINRNAFSGCENLRINVEKGNSVFSSENGTLYNADKTTLLFAGAARGEETFVIPDTVRTIGEYAFARSQYKKVLFGKNVEVVGTAAFAYSAVEEIVCNDGLKEIGGYAFYWMTEGNSAKAGHKENVGELLTIKQRLTDEENPTEEKAAMRSIRIPASVDTIGHFAFAGQPIESIDLSACAVTEITEGCFLGTGLKEIVFPAKLTRVGEQAFSKSAIESLDLPEGLIVIEGGAFSGCAELSSLTLPRTLRKLGWTSSAFLECPKLKTLVIPQSVTGMHYYFSDVESLYFEGNRPIGENGSSVSFVGPKLKNLYAPANAYGWDFENGLRNTPTLREWNTDSGEKQLLLHLPTKETFLSVGEVSTPIRLTAFGGADLSHVTWSSSDLTVAAVDTDGTVVATGDGSTVIRAVSADGAVGELVLYSADPQGFEWHLLDDDTVAIDGMFDRSGIENGALVIPEKIAGFPVSTISTDAFSCERRDTYKDITSVTLPDSITKIGRMAFNNCTSLREVNLPDGITSIGEWGFAHTALESVTLPKSLEVLSIGAFRNCEQLKTLVIDCPELYAVSEHTVWSLGDPFANCTSLETIDFVSLPEIGQGWFANCVSLESVTLPENLEVIGSGAFNNCSSLKEVTVQKYSLEMYEQGNSSKGLFHLANPELVVYHPDDGNNWAGRFGSKAALAVGSGKSTQAGPRIFEIVRDAFVENPVMLTAIYVFCLALVLCGGFSRYKKSKH